MRGIVLAMILAPVGIDEEQLRFEPGFEPRAPSRFILPPRLHPFEPPPPAPAPEAKIILISLA